jgi:hypothetical protein
MPELSMGHRAAAAAAMRCSWLAALASLLVAGCATPPSKLPNYVAPAGAPTAKLVMRGSVPSGDVFGVFVHDDAENCKGARLAGAGNSARNPTTVPLAAGALTTVDFMLVKPNKESCLVRWSFKPEAGKSYVVNGMAFGSGCRAGLLDASNPDAMKAPPGIVRRDGKGTSCVPMAQAARSGGSAAQGGQDQGAAVLRPTANADDLQGLIGQ